MGGGDPCEDVACLYWGAPVALTIWFAKAAIDCMPAGVDMKDTACARFVESNSEGCGRFAGGVP